MNRILIAGCGYVGRRLITALRQQKPNQEIIAMVNTPGSRSSLTGQVNEVIQTDLDQDITLGDTAIFQAQEIFYFVPPPPSGRDDRRIARFLNMISHRTPPKRVVLISTTGVYGDCHGDWIDETQPVNPKADRAWRRLDAEEKLRRWGQEHQVETIILRVAGIYGPQRLPVSRLEKRLPMVSEEEAPWTNRIHVDDLATVCLAAMDNGLKGEVYNVSDGHPGNMTEYFNRVADITGLPRPPLVKLADAQGNLSAGMMSYLQESRRLNNQKMLHIPGVLLRYPTLDTGLKACIT